MKKSLVVASVASVAMTAMPLAQVFAVNFTDTINLEIGNNCTFARQTTAHGATGTWNPSGTATDVLTKATISLNQESTLGSSKFKVVCNNHDGYQVLVDADDLAVSGGDTMTYNKTGTAAAGTWRLTSDGTGQNIAQDKVAYEQAETSDESFEVTYYAYPSAAQGAGDYTGDVEYTFSQL